MDTIAQLLTRLPADSRPLTLVQFRRHLFGIGSGGNYMKQPYIFALSAAALLAWGTPAAPAFAHGGGLNAEGCHNNRKTGDYHCHRGPSASSSSSKKQASYSASIGGAFRNCAAARAAGAAPVRRGDPGYGSHLDRDDDGVGCE